MSRKRSTLIEFEKVDYISNRHIEYATEREREVLVVDTGTKTQPGHQVTDSLDIVSDIKRYFKVLSCIKRSSIDTNS